MRGLTQLRQPENRGFAIGLCGGFYLCGLLSKEEWEAFLARISGRQLPRLGYPARWH